MRFAAHVYRAGRVACLIFSVVKPALTTKRLLDRHRERAGNRADSASLIHLIVPQSDSTHLPRLLRRFIVGIVRRIGVISCESSGYFIMLYYWALQIPQDSGAIAKITFPGARTAPTRQFGRKYSLGVRWFPAGQFLRPRYLKRGSIRSPF